MWSDVFFNLGYALFWIGLFAVARKGPLRLVVILLFHTTTVLVVVITTVAHHYFLENGTTLDYGTIAEWVPKFQEVVPILFQGRVPVLAWIIFAAALLYAALGPLFVSRAAEQCWGWPEGRLSAETVFLDSLGLLLLALVFGSLSVLTGTTTLARAPFVNLVITGIKQVNIEEKISNVGRPTEHPAAHASLTETSRTEKRNVVLIHLESTRAQSVTPYSEDLKTTPFLDELAKSSLLVERAYVVVPRSSKATVTVNCGIDPPLYQGPEYEPGGIPVPCLGNLLKDQGYDTVFFQSSSEKMDQYAVVSENLGYKEYYPSESMDTEGFEATNYISYEDDIMLEPSEQWLQEHKDKPFLAQYVAGTGHDDYRCLSTRYGSANFDQNDDRLNRYLNCLRLQDIFLRNLIDQYEKLGLYENTVFMIYGDHGQEFGRHGRFLHGDTPWEEGLRIPLIIHDPKRFQNGERVKGLSNQTDILPTVVEMLGYQVENGEYPGYSLLRPLPEDRTLRFSCISSLKCLARIKNDEKYIYHYDNQPEEVFDLSEDPLEEHNLADEHSKADLDKWREDLVAWLSSVNSYYSANNSS
jgi:lipoteichoic acid synthase